MGVDAVVVVEAAVVVGHMDFQQDYLVYHSFDRLEEKVSVKQEHPIVFSQWQFHNNNKLMNQHPIEKPNLEVQELGEVV